MTGQHRRALLDSSANYVEAKSAFMNATPAQRVDMSENSGEEAGQRGEAWWAQPG
jgi:hypothetical protein